VTGPVDVVVVGAGAAGLAAGRAAAANGLSCAVLEAKHRAGGRAYTEWQSFGTPFDHGCQWLHSGSINPFARLADRYGVRYLKTWHEGRYHDGRGWLPPDENQAALAAVTAGFEAVETAGAAGRDIAAAAALDPVMPYMTYFRRAYTGYMAAEPELVSTFDSSRYRDTGENWPVVDGYGALVVRHGAPVPVAFDCPATRIDWSGRGVRVETPRGTIAARAAIVTASTGALANGRLRFTPDLPPATAAALDALPMGTANKIGVAFDGDPFGGVAPHFVQLAGEGRAGAGFQVAPFGRPMATAYLGGRLATELEAEGPAAMIAYAREKLAVMFGSAILDRIVAVKPTAWQGDPWIAGAYSVARPGQGDARAALARPIADRLFFAGEAASLDAFATAHGAHLTGEAAIAAVRRVLR
jgi:monoamine oxidase